MKLKVLGCAGGIGGREKFTTCLLIDHDILVDAGTGISSLDIDQLALIDHIFITHSHLDHVAGVPLLLDAVMGKRTEPITVHATEKVIAALKNHLFNWILWPDFTQIPNPEHPALRWAPMPAGATIDLGGRLMTSCPVDHTVDATAYWIHNSQKGLLFTGDMASTPALWAKFAGEPKLERVIVDCSFPNEEWELASKSKHFCPRALIDDIAPMAKSVEFLIYHLKPGQEELIMEELTSASDGRVFKSLKREDVFVF